MRTGVEHEIAWGHYVIGDNVTGINKNLIERYIKYIGNLRVKAIGLEPLFEGYNENPAPWVDYYADANQVKQTSLRQNQQHMLKQGALIDDL